MRTSKLLSLFRASSAPAEIISAVFSQIDRKEIFNAKVKSSQHDVNVALTDNDALTGIRK